MFAGNFAPAGWLFCSGQLLSIDENEVLFQLIGTTYGGDGESTFALPNLQSRIPIHFGTATSGLNYQLGEMAGVEEVTLSVQQIPAHSHPPGASTNPGNSASPANAVPATNTTALPYGATPPVIAMNPSVIQPAGGSQPHENMQPFLCINFIISLFGVFPSPN